MFRTDLVKFCLKHSRLQFSRHIYPWHRNEYTKHRKDLLLVRLQWNVTDMCNQLALVSWRNTSSQTKSHSGGLARALGGKCFNVIYILKCTHVIHYINTGQHAQCDPDGTMSSQGWRLREDIVPSGQHLLSRMTAPPHFFSIQEQNINPCIHGTEGSIYYRAFELHPRTTCTLL